MKLSIISQGFSSWGGGIDFIRHLARLISLADKENTIKKSLILPGADWISGAKFFLFPLLGIANNLKVLRNPQFCKRFIFSKKYFQETFDDQKNNYDLIYSGSTFSSQIKAIKKISPDVVFPLMEPPPVGFNIPWVGYIYDFQHKYLPEFFTAEKIQYRNRIFAEMLTRSSHIMVNAKSVANDARHFHPESVSKIYAIPFSPCPSKLWLDLDIDARREYGINRPYFMISNQFWRHKDHITAFHAFARYLESGGRAMLVCTGETVDYRFPNYFFELMNLIKDLNISENVMILGHISKIDQIALMKKSIAVIQPSLFEGGPGGGAAYDAISLGIPLIASNIPVNLEIDCGDVTYFLAGNHSELCDALLDRGVKTYGISKALLWEDGISRAIRAGNFIINMANDAVKNAK